MRISALNRKLLAISWQMKAQALAIADGRGGRRRDVRHVPVELCLAAAHPGGLLRSPAVCRRVRVAQARAATRGGPTSPAMPGVSAIETRVVANVTLDLRAARRARHRATRCPIPADRRPSVNDLFLRRGRWIEPGRPDEVLASEGFVDRRTGSSPGDSVPAVINGRLRRLTIVGVALVARVHLQHPARRAGTGRQAIRPSSGWIVARSARAFDMEGGFNDVVLSARAR